MSQLHLLQQLQWQPPGLDQPCRGEAVGSQTVWIGEVVAHAARFGGGSLVGVEESFDTANHVGGD